MYTFVTSQSDLQGWDGATDLFIRNSFEITTDFTPITVQGDVTIQGNGFVLSVKNTDITLWDGFLIVTTAMTLTFKNVIAKFDYPLQLNANNDIIFNTIESTSSFTMITYNSVVEMLPVFATFMFSNTCYYVIE